MRLFVTREGVVLMTLHLMKFLRIQDFMIYPHCV